MLDERTQHSTAQHSAAITVKFDLLREELFTDNCAACLLGQSKAKQVRIAEIYIWNAGMLSIVVVQDVVKQLRGPAPWSKSSVVKQLRARSKTRCAPWNGLEGYRRKPATKVVKVVSKRTTSYVDESREHKVLRGTAVRLRVCVYICISSCCCCRCCGGGLWWWFDQLHNFRALGLTRFTRFPFIFFLKKDTCVK